MKCDSCKTIRLESDFVNNQKYCYHCMYRIKTQKISKNRKLKKLLCRTCGKEFMQNENVKKRQRTVFCSSDCAFMGHKKQLNNHWTRKIHKDDSWNWKGNKKWTTNHA